MKMYVGVTGMINKDRIFACLKSNNVNPVNVLILGDVMLDQYVFGDSERISPEAPVPVVNCEMLENRLGGAANVALNLKKLQCNVFLVGLTGNDIEGDTLEKLLLHHNVDFALFRNAICTTTKKRIIVKQQQVLRIDTEKVFSVEASLETQIMEKIRTHLVTCNLAIISDYNKGICTPALCSYVIQLCRELRIPVIVDPKGENWSKYRGANYITPNVKELGDSIGRPIVNEVGNLQAVCHEWLHKYTFENIIVKRSEKGLSVFQTKEDYHFPAKAKEIFDVSGAGDTVVATLAFGLLQQLPIQEALYLANYAAGIVVGKMGTYALSLAELVCAFSQTQESAFTENKIVEKEHLQQLVTTWRQSNETIVFTNGCFDLLHIGHIRNLQRASTFGHRLIVGLNSDTSVKKLKGNERPFVQQKDRAYVLSALACVDAVIIFNEDTPEQLIAMIEPDVLVKGGDYKIEEIAGHNFAKKVEVVPIVKGYSTTNLAKSIHKGFKNEKA